MVRCPDGRKRFDRGANAGGDRTARTQLSPFPPPATPLLLNGPPQPPTRGSSSSALIPSRHYSSQRKMMPILIAGGRGRSGRDGYSTGSYKQPINAAVIRSPPVPLIHLSSLYLSSSNTNEDKENKSQSQSKKQKSQVRPFCH